MNLFLLISNIFNVGIESDYLDLKIGKSTIKNAGKGLFTRRKFKEDEILTEFRGIIIGNEFSENKIFDSEERMLYLNEKYSLLIRNIAGYANDCVDFKKYRKEEYEKFQRNYDFPLLENCVYNSRIEINGNKAFLIGIRDLNENEEIFVKYGFEYWDNFYKNSISNQCISCSYQYYLNISTQMNKNSINSSDCILKKQLIIRDILILHSECENCDLTYFDKTYYSFLEALKKENEITKNFLFIEINIFLQEGKHIIPNIDNSIENYFFRRSLANITIKPLIGKYSELIFETNNIFLLISKSLVIENIIFDGTNITKKYYPYYCLKKNDCFKDLNFDLINEYKGLFNLEYIFEIENEFPIIALNNCSFFNFYDFEINKGFHSLINLAIFSGSLFINNCIFKNIYLIIGIIYYSNSNLDFFYENALKIINENDEYLKNIENLNEIIIIKNSKFLFINRNENNAFSNIFYFFNWENNIIFENCFFTDIENANIILFKGIFSKGNLTFILTNFIDLKNSTIGLISNIKSINLTKLYISNNEINKNLLMISNLSNVFFNYLILNENNNNLNDKCLFYFDKSIIKILNSNFFFMNFNSFFCQKDLSMELKNISFYNITFKNSLIELTNIQLASFSYLQLYSINGKMGIFYFSNSKILNIEKLILKKSSFFTIFFIINSIKNIIIEFLVSNNFFYYFWKDEQSCIQNYFNKSMIISNYISERIIKNFGLQNIYYYFNEIYVADNNSSSLCLIQFFEGYFYFNKLLYINNIFLDSRNYLYNMIFQKNSISYFENCYFVDSGTIFKKNYYISFTDNTIIKFWTIRFSLFNNTFFIISKKFDMATGFISGNPLGNKIEIKNSIFLFLSTNEKYDYKGILLDSFKGLLLFNNSFMNIFCNKNSFSHMHGAIILTASSSYSFVKNLFDLKIIDNYFYNCSCFYGGSIAIISIGNVLISGCKFNKSKSIYFGGSFVIISSPIIFLKDIIIFESSAEDGGAFFLNNIDNINIDNIYLNDIIANKQGIIILKFINNIRINCIMSNNTKAKTNAGFLYIFSTYLVITNSKIFNSNALNECGVFFIHGKSFFFADNIITCNITSLKSGILSGVFSSDIILKNSYFIYCYTINEAGAFSFNILNTILIYNIKLKFIYSNGMGIIFVKTEDQNSIFNFLNISCLNTFSVIGSCIYFLSSAKLNIFDISIKENGNFPIYLSWPFNIFIKIENALFHDNFYNSTILFSLNANLCLFYIKIINNFAAFPIFVIQNSIFELNYLIIYDCYYDFIFNFISSFILIYDTDIANNNKELKFINSIYSDIKIFNAKINNLKSSENMILFKNGNLHLNNISVYSNIGKILHSINSNINITDCNFDNNTESETILYVDSQFFTFDLLILNVKFNIYNENCCFFNGQLNIKINNTKFENFNLKNQKVTSCLFFNSLFIVLTNSSFYRFRNSALYIKTESKNVIISDLTMIKMENCTFYENFGILGGAIQFIGYLDILINNCKFEKNEAKNYLIQKKLQGIGGCIFFQNLKYYKKSKLEISLSSFINNKAMNYYSLIFSQNILIFKNDNMIINQTELITNIFSSPISTKLCKINDNLTNIINITSGVKFDLCFLLIDRYNKTLYFDNTTLMNLKISNQRLNQSFSIENNINISYNGIVLFQNLIIKTNPKSNFSLILSGNFHGFSGEEINYQFIISEYFFFSRECIEGEIILQDSSCYKCPFGAYSLINPMLIELKYQKCFICPQNAICLGGNNISPLFGFYRKNNKSTNVVQCINRNACLGTTTSNLNDSILIHGECLKGNKGPLCYSCEMLYGKKTKTDYCTECASLNSIFFLKSVVIILFAIFYILVNFYFAEKNKKIDIISTCIKQIVNHTQQFSVILISSDINLPSISYFFDFSDFISFGNEDSYSNDCFFEYFNLEFKFLIRNSINTILPLIFSILSFLFWTLGLLFLGKCLKFVNLIEKMPQNLKELLQRIILFLVLSAFIFYSLILKSCFKFFDCKKLDINEKVSYLLDFEEMECWGKKHLQYFSLFGLTGIFIWGIFFPFFLTIILRKNYQLMNILDDSNILINNNVIDKDISKIVQILKIKKKFKSDLEKKKIIRSSLKLINENKVFSFFYKDYGSVYYYWESLIFFRKFIIILLCSLKELLSEEPKNIILLSIIIFYILITNKNQPFKNNNGNILEILSLFALLVTIVSSSAIKSNSNLEIRYLFSILLISFNIIFFTYNLVLIMKLVLKKKTRIKISNNKVKKVQIKNKKTLDYLK